MRNFDAKGKNAAQTLISSLQEEMIKADLVKPWDAEERAILKAMFAKKMINEKWERVDITEVLSEVFRVSEDVKSDLL